MFVVTTAQMQNLGFLDCALIARKTLAVLVQRDPRLAQESVREEAAQLLKRAVTRAVEVLGCRTESSAADYAGLVYSYGFGFEEDPRVAEILARPDLDIAARLQAVFHELVDEDWHRLQEASAHG